MNNIFYLQIQFVVTIKIKAYIYLLFIILNKCKRALSFSFKKEAHSLIVYLHFYSFNYCLKLLNDIYPTQNYVNIPIQNDLHSDI